MKKKLALVVLSEAFASYKILTENLLPYLNKAFEMDTYDERNLLDLDVARYDLIYMNKNSSRAAAEVAASAHQRGIPLIYETDDNFLPPPEAESGIAHTHSPEAQKHIMYIASAATAILVYSRQSYADFSKFNENVAILPTYQSAYTAKAPSANSGMPVIGFMGTSLKDINFSWVTPALHEAAKMRPELRFEFLGFIPEGAQNLPNLSYCGEYLDYSAFISAFRKKQWTIGLAPLADIAFNHSKTNNKYREYAAAGYAGIYSNVEPYSNTVKAGQTGLLAGNTAEEWLNAIISLLDDDALRAGIVNNAWHDIKDNYQFDDYCRNKMRFLLQVAAAPSATGVRKAVKAAMAANRQITL